MATNPNVDRLATSLADSRRMSISELPDFPEIPQAIKDRNPLWNQYDADVKKFWENFKGRIRDSKAPGI